MTDTTTTCPRCKREVIAVKDWGKAGKLFVHSETVENGMPVRDACHVPADELVSGALRWTTDLRGRK